MTLWKDRLLGALVPIATVIIGSMSSLFGFLTPLVCYFIFRKFENSFVATNAMRYFDICITAIIFAVSLFVLQFSLGVVAKDAGGNVPFLSDGIIYFILNSGVMLYLFIAVVLHVIFPLLGKEFKMPFSVRLFEALIKYNSNKPIQSSADASTD